MTDTDSEHELRVRKIKNGTVIDHLPAGIALEVLDILDIDGSQGSPVSLAMNVPSETQGRKDIVKIEDRELTEDEVAVLALLGDAVTINIIRGYDVADKLSVTRPETVEGVLECPTTDCITNAHEPVTPTFTVLDTGVQCTYCEAIISDDLAAHLTP